MDTYHCPECNQNRSVDIIDFLYSNAKQVICGHCNTVLITEDEALDIFCLGYLCEEFL